MRAFIAITLPPEARHALAGLIRQLEPSGADVKWVASGHLHLTMKFLGDISEEQRQAAEALLRRVAAQEPAFSMDLAEVGAFPSIGAPRVLWAGVGTGQDEAARIAAAIEEGSRAFGIKPEERAFAAHVTIGRVRSPRGASKLAARLGQMTWRPPPAWTVRLLTLFESVLGSSGPAYTPLAEFPLRVPGATS